MSPPMPDRVYLHGKRRTEIRLDRFRPTSTGYRLVSEGEARDA